MCLPFFNHGNRHVVFGRTLSAEFLPLVHESVDECVRVPRAHDLLVIDRDVLEEREQVDLLLVAGSEQVVIGQLPETLRPFLLERFL